VRTVRNRPRSPTEPPPNSLGIGTFGGHRRRAPSHRFAASRYRVREIAPGDRRGHNALRSTGPTRSKRVFGPVATVTTTASTARSLSTCRCVYCRTGHGRIRTDHRFAAWRFAAVQYSIIAVRQRNRSAWVDDRLGDFAGRRCCWARRRPRSTDPADGNSPGRPPCRSSHYRCGFFYWRNSDR
jgi:hypothetical protein